MGGVAEIMLYVTGEAAFHIIIFFFCLNPHLLRSMLKIAPWLIFASYVLCSHVKCFMWNTIY